MSDVVFEGWQGAAPRLGTRSPLRGLLKPALAGLGLVAMAALCVGALRAPPTAPVVAPAASLAPPPSWREILKPVHIYHLSAPQFGGAAETYTARVHAPDGGREDFLTLGAFAGEKPALRLRLFRGRQANETSFETTLAREAADLRLSVAYTGRVVRVATKIGRFEVAAMTLGVPDGADRSCAGMRLTLDKPALAIAGLYCGRGGAALTRTEVGCLLERLDVASARDDRDLIDFFAAGELRRNAACKGARLGPDSLHPAWLDEKPLVKAKPATKVGKAATGHRSLRRH